MIYFLLSLCLFSDFKFAVIGDTQARHRVFKRAMADINRKKITMGVHVGDLYHCGRVGKWGRIKNTIKWYPVIGNHELVRCAGHEYRAVMKRRWVKYWYGSGDTLRILSFRGWTFVLLDTSTNYILAEHLPRLTRVFSTAEKILVFAHRPLPVLRSSRIYYGKKWHWYSFMGPLSYTRQNRKLAKMLNYRVKAIFHGHHHAYRKYQINGIPAYCTGGGGGTLSTRKDFYHYLIVNLEPFSVQVVKI